MAAAKQLQGLKEEAMCSICLDYFTDPVNVECGHVFCLSCIARCWEGLQTDFPCPQCRETFQIKTFRPNRQLGNMVELLQQLHTPSASIQGENVCQEHEEKLKLFCEEDQKPICVVCRESKDHKAHSVFPIKEAAQDYKKTLSTHLGRLQMELEKLQTWEAEQRRRAADLEGNFKDQIKMIRRTFELLKQFLDKEEQQLLSNLEKQHQERMKKIQGEVTELEQSIRRDLIKEIEEKCQQEDVHLLKGVQSILNRCTNMKIQKPEEGNVARKSVQSIGKHASLQEKLLELKETFRAELEWRYVRSCASAVTLDPDTANRSLILSPDRRSVRHGYRAQDLPDTSQRFDPEVIVLGRERLSSGRHYWEVEVGDTTGWSLGVCDEAVSRKGDIILVPEKGFWAVWLRDGEYIALTSSSTLLSPRVPPRAVGLFLDYEAGRLSVYNVDDRSLFFTFSGASFPPTLRPYFNPELDARVWNAGALRILPAVA